MSCPSVLVVLSGNSYFWRTGFRGPARLLLKYLPRQRRLLLEFFRKARIQRLTEMKLPDQNDFQRAVWQLCGVRTLAWNFMRA